MNIKLSTLHKIWVILLEWYFQSMNLFLATPLKGQFLGLNSWELKTIHWLATDFRIKIQPLSIGCKFCTVSLHMLLQSPIIINFHTDLHLFQATYQVPYHQTHSKHAVPSTWDILLPLCQLKSFSFFIFWFTYPFLFFFF